VYRVQKLKDCNRNGEVLSTSNLERLSCFITSTILAKLLKIQLLTQGTLLILTPKVIDCRKNSFVERTQPFGNFSKRNRAGCTNKSRFN
jgi:hypothetical protein